MRRDMTDGGSRSWSIGRRRRRFQRQIQRLRIRCSGGGGGGGGRRSSRLSVGRHPTRTGRSCVERTGRKDRLVELWRLCGVGGGGGRGGGALHDVSNDEIGTALVFSVQRRRLGRFHQGSGQRRVGRRQRAALRRRQSAAQAGISAAWWGVERRR